MPSIGEVTCGQIISRARCVYRGEEARVSMMFMIFAAAMGPWALRIDCLTRSARCVHNAVKDIWLSQVYCSSLIHAPHQDYWCFYVVQDMPRHVWQQERNFDDGLVCTSDL